MFSKRKSIGSPISLRSSGKRELSKILSKPQTKKAKESVQSSTAAYLYHKQKWQRNKSK